MAIGDQKCPMLLATVVPMDNKISREEFETKALKTTNLSDAEPKGPKKNKDKEGLKTWGEVKVAK